MREAGEDAPRGRPRPPPPPSAARARSLMTATQPETRGPRRLEAAGSWRRGAGRGAESAAETVAIPASPLTPPRPGSAGPD